MTDEQDRAQQNFNIASRNVAKCLNLRQGGSKAESEYAATFLQMARLGMVQKLRKKYR